MFIKAACKDALKDCNPGLLQAMESIQDLVALIVVTRRAPSIHNGLYRRSSAQDFRAFLSTAVIVIQVFSEEAGRFKLLQPG